MRDIYYNNYYKASGADQLENPQLGLYTFDTAVNMGVGIAKDLLKQSGGSLDTFEKLRRDKYQSYADAKANQKNILMDGIIELLMQKLMQKILFLLKKLSPFNLALKWMLIKMVTL